MNGARGGSPVTRGFPAEEASDEAQKRKTHDGM